MRLRLDGRVAPCWAGWSTGWWCWRSGGSSSSRPSCWCSPAACRTRPSSTTSTASPRSVTWIVAARCCRCAAASTPRRSTSIRCRLTCRPLLSRWRTGASTSTGGSIRSASPAPSSPTSADATRPRGASTITQQLARNLFLTPDQTIKRKVQELLLAVWLEHQYNKKQILALYLNRVYFGAGAYGIESASETFFNKPASKLSVGEAALLAALLKSPTHYSPVNEQDRRRAPRHHRARQGWWRPTPITSQQREDALSHPVRVSPALATQHAQYFVDWVDQQVRKLVGQPTTDLIVETTLDLPIDTAAEAAARAVVDRNAHLGVQQAAVVALDGSGRVRALIGGISYADSQFDRAIDARRQAGSAWKPFVYLTALENGRTPDTVMNDEPVTIDGWSPHNFEPGFLGPVTLTQAFQRSLNTGRRGARRPGRARQGGRHPPARSASPRRSTPTPAMALGTSQVSPLEMAQAYDSFSNGGRAVQALRHRAHPHPRRQGALPAFRRRARRRCPAAPARRTRRHDAPGAGRARHGGARGHPALRPRRQDRHDQRFPRRLVRGLHRRLHRSGVGRQGRRHAHAPRHRRLRPSRPVAPVHDRRPAAPEGCRRSRPARARPRPRPRTRTPSPRCSATRPAWNRAPTTTAKPTKAPIGATATPTATAIRLHRPRRRLRIEPGA